MTNQKMKPVVDPAVQAAKITRTGAVIGVVVAALITGTATGVTAYFSGRKDGVQAAPVSTVLSVQTVTMPNGASATETTTSSTMKPGETSLLDMTQIESSGESLSSGDQTIDTKTYSRTLATTLKNCSGKDFASRTYQLNRKHKTFHVTLGLTDQSDSGSAIEFRIAVDNKRVDSATVRLGVGQVKSIDVDLTGAFRFTIETQWIAPIDRQYCYATSAGVAWIEPTLA
ncbi:NPCBM/NEW2 domain-containing protein [Umezawaea sp. Da 62-37]|uniref:NPCBM/NEW2 domain-containing protein n=1 Tax=Umezawaea sp. Da 62-37 TaxID=3075927 RepID=UPI0028F72772|nr:NPCBM/NEW2 domain-containing protein [Umezawaea sp. Da 62-37]WNV84730.1 NPCBM/NEW2 domain-containing protein [Umezawaea sp. Da 62-37]